MRSRMHAREGDIMLKWERFKKANGIAKGTIVPAFRKAYNELEEEILKKEAEKLDIAEIKGITKIDYTEIYRAEE